MRRLLPPVLVVILLGLMGVFQYWLPGPAVVPATHRWWGAVPLFSGVALLVVARLQFARRHTNIYTFDEPGSLVTDGVFRISRHPMYLGFALALLGAAVLFGSLSALLLAVVYLPIADRWYIVFEERALLRKFGAAYAEYQRRVRRWL